MRLLTRHRGDDAPPQKRRGLSALLSFGLIAASLTTGSLLAAPTAAEAAPNGPAWTCSANGYLFQTVDNTTDVHSIYQVDLVTGESSEIGRTADDVNAIGFNTTDNYVYGVNVDTGHLVQVASDGTETVLPDPSGYIPSGYNVGDFDDAGHLWITHSGNAQRWYEIDYAAGSPTYGQILATGTVAGATIGSDWVFVEGSLYSVPNNTNHLVRFDTATRTATDLGALANFPVGAAYGAGYADAAGNLYFSNNTTGEIYRVTPSDRTVIDLSSGPISGGNDGARCANAPIPTITVQKTVDGRAAAADQFTVALRDTDASTLTSATTTGVGTTATSQDWPVSQGRTYTITDSMAAGSTNTLAAYTPTIVCTDTATGVAQTVGGTTGTWTFRVPGTDPYLCNVTNTAKDPSLAVSKTVDKTSAKPGDKVTYTVTVRNTGDVAYTAENPATFTDDLSKVTDDATYNKDASNGATVDGNTLSWSGPLAVGATTTVTYSFTVNTPDTGDKNLVNAVTTTGACAPNACQTETLVRSFTVTKSVDTDSATPGQKVTYTVTVKNTGTSAYTAESPATFTDDLSKVADDATYNKDASNGATVDGNTLSWSGPLAVGATTTVTYSFTVNTPDTGDHALGNTVVPGDSGSCDPASSCITNTPVAGYAVSKSVDKTSVAPGETVKWTITVTNTGQVDYTAANPAKFTDDLTQVTDDATYNGDASNGATVDGNTLTWSGPLAVGKTTTVTYSFTVKNPNPGDEQLRNVVDPGPGTGTCLTAGSCETNTTVTTHTITPGGPAPVGPTVSTGGTTAAPLWPMFAGAGTALAVLMALLAMTVLRRRNGDGV